eukprot:COSAG01_NODE_9395_length_2456_cov_1.263783_4_plen_122_part_00
MVHLHVHDVWHVYYRRHTPRVPGQRNCLLLIANLRDRMPLLELLVLAVATVAIVAAVVIVANMIYTHIVMDIYLGFLLLLLPPRSPSGAPQRGGVASRIFRHVEVGGAFAAGRESQRQVGR